MVTNLCESRQVNQRQVQNLGGEDLQIDGLAVDALVTAGDPGGLVLDLPFDIAKVIESTAGNVVEFGPFVPGSFCWVPVANAHRVFGFVVGDVD